MHSDHCAMTALDLDGLRAEAVEFLATHFDADDLPGVGAWLRTNPAIENSPYGVSVHAISALLDKIATLEREVMQAREAGLEAAAKIADAYDGGEWEANTDAAVAAQAGRDIASYIRAASRKAALSKTSSKGAS